MTIDLGWPIAILSTIGIVCVLVKVIKSFVKSYKEQNHHEVL
jgi:hypothetical protein